MVPAYMGSDTGQDLRFSPFFGRGLSWAGPRIARSCVPP